MNGKTKLMLLMVATSGCSGGAGSDSGSGDQPPAITAAAIRSGVLALSSDEMEGRGTGTEGGERAAAWIEQRFREIGLAPVEGSYRQPVSLVGFEKVADGSRLEVSGPGGGLELVEGGNATWWSSAQKEEVSVDEAPLVFVGYGVEAPEYGWDDFKGRDLAGEVLLFLNDDPPVSEGGAALFGGEARTYYGRWTYKYEQAMRHGAAGAIVIHTTPSASYPFSVVQDSGTSEHFALDLPDTGYQVDLLGWIDEETAGRVAAALDTDLEGLFARAASRDFEPVDTGFRVSARIRTAIRRLETSNVMGMVEGRDPALQREVVVFSAHYDHLGVDADPAADDPIFNGAWDNAAGTAAIVELGRAFAAAAPPPRRTLLFLACAAEENGSLGSQWFVAQPPFERSRLVANFNVDMPQIFGVTRDVAAIGVETNSLGDALREAAGAAGVRVTGDPNPGAGSFYRSDQVNFAKAGIPALFVLPGRDYDPPLGFDPVAYREERYHQPGDELDERWDLAGAARDMQLVYRAALAVANADAMPRWRPGHEFEEEWRALHEAE
jgi:Zn-dependent M28 family amino/carboxypeptidase